MIYKSSESNPNTRIRSFLSPLSRFGNRSFSTSELCSSSGSEPQKTYIEFKKITRINGEVLNKRVNNQAKLAQFCRSPEEKPTKLWKANINRNTHKYERATCKPEKHEKNEENLLQIIRELNEQIHTLQVENRLETMFLFSLFEKHEEDIMKIAHQTKIIRNLEEAICLCRKQSSSCVDTEIRELNDENKKSEIEEALKLKIGELAIENNRIIERYELVVEELERMKIECLDVTKEETRKNFNENLLNKNEDDLEIILMEIERKKMKEFEQIDSLLFNSYV